MLSSDAKWRQRRKIGWEKPLNKDVTASWDRFTLYLKEGEKVIAIPALSARKLFFCLRPMCQK